MRSFLACVLTCGVVSAWAVPVASADEVTIFAEGYDGVRLGFNVGPDSGGFFDAVNVDGDEYLFETDGDYVGEAGVSAFLEFEQGGNFDYVEWVNPFFQGGFVQFDDLTTAESDTFGELPLTVLGSDPFKAPAIPEPAALALAMASLPMLLSRRSRPTFQSPRSSLGSSSWRSLERSSDSASCAGA